MTDTTKESDLKVAIDGLKHSCLRLNKYQRRATVDIDDVELVLTAFEAERQRSSGSEEELHKALHREKAAERKLLAAQDSIGVLEGVIARKDFDSQKGEQVPVAWTSQRSLETKNKIVAFTDDMSALDYGVANGWTDIVELFTAPQKPVVLPQVRTRDDYESRLGNGDIGPYNHGHLEGWNAAIEVAGGKVAK